MSEVQETIVNLEDFSVNTITEGASRWKTSISIRIVFWSPNYIDHLKFAHMVITGLKNILAYKCS